jgi:hypothetical protein
MKIKELIEDATGMGAGGFATVSMPFVRMHRKRKNRAMRKESGTDIIRRQPYANIAEEKDTKKNG